MQEKLLPVIVKESMDLSIMTSINTWLSDKKKECPPEKLTAKSQRKKSKQTKANT